MVLKKGAQAQVHSQIILDGLSQGVLIFDSANRLVQDNAAARALFGADLKLLRAEGWAAASALFNARVADATEMVETTRARAVASGQPVRFHIYRSGERVPCWMAVLHAPDDTYLMITIETPDWTAISDLMDTFMGEVREAVIATSGHADLIMQSVTHAKPGDSAEQLGRRLSGFTRVIGVHMYRLAMLTDLVERLERIRTGQMHDQIYTRSIVLSDFMEDFLETLNDSGLADPESDTGDCRSRIRADIAEKVTINATPQMLAQVLRDILRNAIMYSKRETPIRVAAYASGESAVQIDVSDEGYGIRASENERVFLPFSRSRQPQILGEFGYGLSLYLCKHEVEAMNGHIWFESEEGVGTTFSLRLPAASSSSEG